MRQETLPSCFLPSSGLSTIFPNALQKNVLHKNDTYTQNPRLTRENSFWMGFVMTQVQEETAPVRGVFFYFIVRVIITILTFYV